MPVVGHAVLTNEAENTMTEHKINLERLRTIRDGSGHSIFGASGSGMFLNCPGALIPNLLTPDSNNPDSAYGTVAHAITEEWGITGKRPDHRIGEMHFFDIGDWDFWITVDAEMLDYAQMCIDWVDFLPGIKHWERWVDYSRITPIPNQGGTADLIIVNLDECKITICDWKFGKGVRVYAERNTQLMLYALGALWEMEKKYGVRFEKIEVRIAQPRLDHFEEWSCDRDELLEFAGWAKARMALAWSVHAPRVAGQKQCEFCRVRPSCAAAAMLNVELTEGVFENLDAEHPVSPEEMEVFKQRLDDEWDAFAVAVIETGSLSTEQLCKLRPYKRVADKWWESIDRELMRRHMNGDNLMQYDFKVVEGRSFRAFTDTEKAVDHLVSLGVPREKLVTVEYASPAQAEALLKKAGHRSKDIPSLLDGLTQKPPGKPTIVHISDRREPLADITEGVFDNLDSTTETEDY